MPVVRYRPTVAVLGRIVAPVAILAAACGGGDRVNGPDTPSLPTIVATTSIWADVVANVACNGVAVVETLIPPGGDPHAFEPSLADRAAMEHAALVVANGLALEEGLDDTLRAVEDSTVVFRVSDHVTTIRYSGASDGHEDEPAGGDSKDGNDPHIWFDPVRVSQALSPLAEALEVEGGLDGAALAACVSDYQARLAAVDEELSDRFSGIADDRRLLVTSHDALGYLADRYGFEVVGTVIPAPSGLAETSPAQLEALARMIEENGIPAVFAESQHSSDDAQALADRVGDIEVVTLSTGSLGEAGAPDDTYIGLLRTTAARIVAALASQTPQ